MPLAPKLRTATYADLQALPSNRVGEIVHGTLYAHPRPTPRHSNAANSLGYEVTGPFGRGRGGPGGWIFLAEPELHLGPHVVVPDIAGWKVERLTPFPNTAFIATPPDWVAEILSLRRKRSTARINLPSTQTSVSTIAGMSIRLPKRSKFLRASAKNGCWPPPSKMQIQSPHPLLRRTRFSWTCCGCQTTSRLQPENRVGLRV